MPNLAKPAQTPAPEGLHNINVVQLAQGGRNKNVQLTRASCSHVDNSVRFSSSAPPPLLFFSSPFFPSPVSAAYVDAGNALAGVVGALMGIALLLIALGAFARTL